MVTIQHIVRKILKNKPFIQEALSKEIINHAALAESFIPEIEKELGKEVKFSAANMAVRREAEKISAKEFKTTFSKDSDLTLRSDLFSFTIYKTDKLKEYLKKLYDLVDFDAGDFLTVTQGIHEIMIISNHKNQDKIAKITPKIKKKISKLCSLTITLAPDSINSVGLFYQVTRALAWENIPIIDIVSTFTEMIVIVKEEYAAKSFEVLKQHIS